MKGLYKLRPGAPTSTTEFSRLANLHKTFFKPSKTRTSQTSQPLAVYLNETRFPIDTLSYHVRNTRLRPDGLSRKL